MGKGSQMPVPGERQIVPKVIPLLTTEVPSLDKQDYRNVVFCPQEDLAVALLLISDRPPRPRRQLSVRLRWH
jgi:hypothetical protein